MADLNLKSVLKKMLIAQERPQVRRFHRQETCLLVLTSSLNHSATVIALLQKDPIWPHKYIFHPALIINVEINYSRGLVWWLCCNHAKRAILVLISPLLARNQMTKGRANHLNVAISMSQAK